MSLGAPVGKTQLELQRLSQERGYHYEGYHSEDVAWLTWTRAAEKNSAISIDEVFPMPGDFICRDYFALSTVEFLMQWRVRSGDDEARDGDLAKQFERQRKRYIVFESRYKDENGFLIEEMLPSLVARQNALKEKLHQIGQFLRTGPLSEIRSLLAVWLAEASRAEQDDEGDAFLLRWQTRGLWDNICQGVPTRRLVGRDEWIGVSLDLLTRYGSSDVLADAQRRRIMEVLAEHRDPALKRARPLSEQLSLSEQVLDNALRGDPLPKWEDLRNLMHGNARHKRRKPWILNTYSKQLQECDSRAEAIQRTQELYAEKFNVEAPSARTIRRYLNEQLGPST